MYSEYERTLKRTVIEIMVDMAAWFGELKCQMCPPILTPRIHDSSSSSSSVTEKTGLTHYPSKG